MATFKPGMKVRLVGGDIRPMIGAEGVIIRKTTAAEYATYTNSEWVVDFPAFRHGPTPLPPTHWGCTSRILAPLTPPAQDEWAADQVRKVTKPTYMEPVRTKERA